MNQMRSFLIKNISKNSYIREDRGSSLKPIIVGKAKVSQSTSTSKTSCAHGINTLLLML